MRETQVWSLGWEDPLEKGMATHSSILPGESHGQRSLAGYSPQGRKESDMTEWLTLNRSDILKSFLFFIVYVQSHGFLLTIVTTLFVFHAQSVYPNLAT